MNRPARRVPSRKLFGGRMTAEEAHAVGAFPPEARCQGCGAAKGLYLRAISFAPLDEVRRRDPMVEALMAYDPEKFLTMVTQLRGADGKPVAHLRVATIYACKPCAPAAERAIAKGPSWIVVDIAKPKPDRYVSGAAGGSAVD